MRSANFKSFALAAFSSGNRSALRMISYRDAPWAAARSATLSMVVAPMPRAGLLTIRRSRRSSRGLFSTHRYASISLTSARSKNFMPPTIL